MNTTPRLVSVHGGHSGQFCNHARDTLEQVIQAYIAKKFSWVGITEHMPPPADCFLYPEERQAGLDAKGVQARFGDYIREGRRLQKKYAGQIEIFIGFETEAYTGAPAFARTLADTYKPDYVLGGVHHVADIPFDYNREAYERAVSVTGSIEGLYCRYFDLQYDLIRTLRPQVVAHFDLIRIFDDDYSRRWRQPEIARRIRRNLELIGKLDLILDYNVAALRKGAPEPYLSGPILDQAKALGIAVVPSDDSHGVDLVGAYIPEGIAILLRKGFDLDWRQP